jgi:hypothetical protein
LLSGFPNQVVAGTLGNRRGLRRRFDHSPNHLIAAPHGLFLAVTVVNDLPAIGKTAAR